MKSYLRKAAILFCMASVLVSCAGKPPASQAGKNAVREGTIVSIHTRATKGDRNSGAQVGSFLGSLAGLFIGEGTGSSVAFVGGAIGGHFAGAEIAGRTNTGDRVENVVRFPGGETLSVEQTRSCPHRYRIGDKVLVSRRGGEYRVIPANSVH